MQSSMNRFLKPVAAGAESAPGKLRPPPGLSLDVDGMALDPQTCMDWIYPQNMEVRRYQLKIVGAALFKNTFCCLPTGTGKTFIAAVVMFNFYRWFPRGTVVFMAPTKPLVAQQVRACYECCGLPQHDTAELTGHIPQRERREVWASKRIIYCTPQVMQNDLKEGICCAGRIVCVVIDEAHKAQGNFAYVDVVKRIASVSRSRRFRILALSATPGKDTKTMQSVFDNLMVSHLVAISEQSPEISQYMHHRSAEIMSVAMSNTRYQQLIETFLNVLRLAIKRLRQCAGRWSQGITAEKVGHYQVMIASKTMRERPEYKALDAGARGRVEEAFACTLPLVKAKEQLTCNGIASFIDKLEELRTRASSGGNLCRDIVGSSQFENLWTLALQARSEDVMHPKLEALISVVINHFAQNDHNRNSKVIIFATLRDTVESIVAHLEQHKPLLRAHQFIGQGSREGKQAGMKQAEQQEVMQHFRNGTYNVIVCTSIGEEGLDVGEVDLVVQYDCISSALRSIQRTGRTGRKRDGRSVVLVAKGFEEDQMKKQQGNSKSVMRAIMNGKFRFTASHRMIPDAIEPQRILMVLRVAEYQTVNTIKNTKAVDAVTASHVVDHAFDTCSWKQKEASLVPATDPQVHVSNEQIYNSRHGREGREFIGRAFAHSQSLPTATHHVQHSSRTKLLVSTVQEISMLLDTPAGDMETDEFRARLMQNILRKRVARKQNRQKEKICADASPTSDSPKNCHSNTAEAANATFQPSQDYDHFNTWTQSLQLTEQFSSPLLRDVANCGENLTQSIDLVPDGDNLHHSKSPPTITDSLNLSATSAAFTDTKQHSHRLSSDLQGRPSTETRETHALAAELYHAHRVHRHDKNADVSPSTLPSSLHRSADRIPASQGPSISKRHSKCDLAAKLDTVGSTESLLPNKYYQPVRPPPVYDATEFSFDVTAQGKAPAQIDSQARSNGQDGGNSNDTVSDHSKGEHDDLAANVVQRNAATVGTGSACQQHDPLLKPVDTNVVVQHTVASLNSRPQAAGLTDEQRRRIAANRAKAQAKKSQRTAVMMQQAQRSAHHISALPSAMPQKPRHAEKASVLSPVGSASAVCTAAANDAPMSDNKLQAEVIDLTDLTQPVPSARQSGAMNSDLGHHDWPARVASDSRSLERC